MVAPTLGAVCSARGTLRPTCSTSQRPATSSSKAGGPVRRALRSFATPQQAPEKGKEAESPPAPAPSTGSRNVVSQSLDDLGLLASRLLMNAASWRVVRGQTHCMHCRGTGRVACSACLGSGIMREEAVRMNQVKHAAGKLKVLLGMNDAKMNDSDWIKSNRCKRCHGSGAVACVYCDGTGRRG